MQSSPKEIYKITATSTGIDEQIYKDIGTFIFKETAEHLKKPKSLIIKLKGIGFWFLRKQRLDRMISYYPPHYEIEGYNEFESERAFLRFIDKKELYEIFKARLRDYEKFLNLKKETKSKQYEFEEIQRSKEDCNQSSQNNS